MTPRTGWSWVRVLALLIISPVVSLGLLSVWRGVEFFVSLRESSAEYDANYDPIVIENGVLRVEGPRVPYSDDANVVIDPGDSVDLDSLRGERTVVFRSHEVVQVRSIERRVYSYEHMMKAMELSSLRIDGASLTEFTNDWGGVMVAAVCGLILVFGVPAHVFGCTLLAAMGAAPIALLWRPPGGPTGMATFRTALGVSAALPPIWVLATLAGHSTACCVDLCVFPPFIGLGTLAVLKLQRR